MNEEKQQKVVCKVETCKHHSDNNSCQLNSIKIKPRENQSSGDKEDESMCSDYKNYEGSMF
jgi:hypothetical protein